jgi:hypothetical protein
VTPSAVPPTHPVVANIALQVTGAA